MKGTQEHVHDERADPTSADGIDHEQAREAVRLLLDALGEDPDRDGLAATWQRRVPDALTELTEGSRRAEKPAMRSFPAETDGLVVKTGIPVYSLCEHHLLPFHGTAHVAYRPGEEMVGLSKLVRYVRWRSRQLTVQERLTTGIAEGLADELDAEAVAVELSATHLCEAMRGVESETTTTTSASVGELATTERRRFRDAIEREEARNG